MPEKIGLFIDTATEQGSIALYKDDKILYNKVFSSDLNHLQVLHPAIEKMLKQAKVSLNDIGYFGVDIGPGSFTGIRIGVTAARTFAQAGKKSIFGTPSLDIISKSACDYDRLVCVIIDGKKNRIYTAFYVNKNDSSERISDYFDIEAGELLGKVNNYKKKYDKVLFLGSGQENYQDILKKCELKPIFTSTKYFYPQAKNIYFCMNKAELSRDYESIIPFYLRKSDAEEKA